MNVVFKKHIGTIFLFFVFALLMCGVMLFSQQIKVVFADTTEELEQKLLQLLTELSILQAKIAQNQTDAQTNAGFVFTRNLNLGSRGEDVRQLQKILNTNFITLVAQNGAGSPGNETDYFGALTRSAVAKFQNAYFEDVLLPVGLVSGTGYVGESTRAKLNELSSEGASVSISLGRVLPKITTISPSTASRNSVITITGENFHSTNNKIGIGGTIYENIPSTNNGKTITLTLKTPTELVGLFGGVDGTLEERTLIAEQTIANLTEDQKKFIRDRIGLSYAHSAQLQNRVNNLPNDFKRFFSGEKGTIPLSVYVEAPNNRASNEVIFNLIVLP